MKIVLKIYSKATAFFFLNRSYLIFVISHSILWLQWFLSTAEFLIVL